MSINELDRSIENNKLMAAWWAEAALNLSCLKRKLYHSDGRAYTDREKVYNACCIMRGYALKVKELMNIRLQMKGGTINAQC
jgi:hypothetical protein